MRLNLDQNGHDALKEIQARCRVLNAHIEEAVSPFLIQLLKSLNETLTKEHWEAVASQLTSARIKRKKLLERLIRLGDKVDESDIEKFELKLEKKRSASELASHPFSAEKS